MLLLAYYQESSNIAIAHLQDEGTTLWHRVAFSFTARGLEEHRRHHPPAPTVGTVPVTTSQS